LRKPRRRACCMASCACPGCTAGTARAGSAADLSCRMHTMSRFLIAVLALLLALPGYAQNARAFRDKVEASMVVTGHVDIGADGSVTAYALDAAEKLPGYVVDLFDRNVPGFRFEPPTTDGEAFAARARMSARIVARKAGEAH